MLGQGRVGILTGRRQLVRARGGRRSTGVLANGARCSTQSRAWTVVRTRGPLDGVSGRVVSSDHREARRASGRPERADLRGHAGRRPRSEVLGPAVPCGLAAPLPVHAVARGARLPDDRPRGDPPRRTAPLRSSGSLRRAAAARPCDPAGAPPRPARCRAWPGHRRRGARAGREGPPGARRGRPVDRSRPPPREPGLLLAPAAARDGRRRVARPPPGRRGRRRFPRPGAAERRPLRGEAGAPPRRLPDRRAAHRPRGAGGRALAPRRVSPADPRDGRARSSARRRWWTSRRARSSTSASTSTRA